jgi:hypothetical protein
MRDPAQIEYDGPRHGAYSGLSYDERAEALIELGRRIEERLARIDKRLDGMEATWGRSVALALCFVPVFLLGFVARAWFAAWG